MIWEARCRSPGGLWGTHTGFVGYTNNCCFESPAASADGTEQGGREVCMASEEIRTEPGIGLASVQRWLSRQKLQAGLSVHPGAHFQPAALDPAPV